MARDADYAGLLDLLKKNGSRLGGETGLHFLRSIGKPAFITMPDAVKALIREQVPSKGPIEKGDLRRSRQA